MVLTISRLNPDVDYIPYNYDDIISKMPCSKFGHIHNKHIELSDVMLNKQLKDFGNSKSSKEEKTCEKCEEVKEEEQLIKCPPAMASADKPTQKSKYEKPPPKSAPTKPKGNKKKKPSAVKVKPKVKKIVPIKLQSKPPNPKRLNRSLAIVLVSNQKVRKLQQPITRARQHGAVVRNTKTTTN